MKKSSVKEGRFVDSLCVGMGQKYLFWFFADDSLLFCQAHLREIQKIQEIMAVDEKVSGQKINSNKTTLFFGKLVSEMVKNFIKDLLGIPEIKQYKKYFGLPTVVGKNRRASLNYIKDRV